MSLIGMAVKNSLAVIACSMLLMGTASARADERAPVAFDISAQSLAAALSEFARQSQQPILFAPEVVANKTSPGVRGSLEVLEGLKELLRDTGLTFSTTRNGAVLIGTPRASVSGPQQFRVAQASGEASQVQQQPSEEGIENAGGKLEEVIVTAQKREERLIEVPISIVALGAQELQQRRIESIDDLAMVVPGLSIQSSGGFQRRIELRGISNTAGSSSLIGMYLDEADVTGFALGTNSQLDLQVADLERVEVLRGPQGTLYGSGSAGGTIRFITRNPALDRFAMSANVAALFTENGAPSQRIEGVVNVPLVEDQLGIRLAGTFDHQGGWIDQPGAHRKDYNDQNLTHVRAKGLWQATPQLTVSTMAVVHRNEGANNAGEDAEGRFTQLFNLTTTPFARDDYDVYNLTLTYDLPRVRVLSSTSYTDQDKESGASALIPLDPPQATLILQSYQPSQLIRNTHLSEELRLTSTSEGPWRWTLGAYYGDARSKFDLPEQFVGFIAPPGTPLPVPTAFLSRDRSKSWAVFGDSSHRLTERLTLGAGLRYFEDEQESASGIAFGEPAALGPSVKGTFHTLNPRAYATYRLTDEVNLYGSAAKGFRSGGFNPGSTRPTFDPESVWTYELGGKFALPGARVQGDLALFCSDYKDYQMVGQIPTDPAVGSITSNAGDARVKGVEWGMIWNATFEWSLSLNGHYVTTRFYRVDATSSTYARGDALDFFPKYAYTASVRRDFTWSGRSSFARLDFNQRGRATFRDRTISPFFFSESGVVQMLNFNASVQWSDALSLGAFAQNLLDDRGFADPLSILGLASRSRPRTFGVDFSFKLSP